MGIINTTHSDLSVGIQAVTANEILGERPWSLVKQCQGEFTEAFLKALQTYVDDKSHPMGKMAVPGEQPDDYQRKTNPYIGQLQVLKNCRQNIIFMIVSNGNTGL